jgi:hypothetical protein
VTSSEVLRPMYRLFPARMLAVVGATAAYFIVLRSPFIVAARVHTAETEIAAQSLRRKGPRLTKAASCSCATVLSLALGDTIPVADE